MNRAKTYLCYVFLSLIFTPSVFAFKCDVTATGISFTNYNIFEPAPLDSTGTINVSCNNPAANPNSPLPVAIALDTGNSGSFAQRQMQGATSSLSYNLYTSAAHSTIWGDGAGGSTVVSNLLTRETPWTATIYGRIPPNQNASPGIYSDAVTVTINY